MSNLSLLVYLVIFWQYIYKWAKGHFVPSYLSKVGTLNFGGNTRSGTKLILLASTIPIRQTLPWPSGIFQWAQASVEPHYFQIVLMISSLASLVPSDHQDLGPLSDQLRLSQNSGPIHSPALEEACHNGFLPRLGRLPKIKMESPPIFSVQVWSVTRDICVLKLEIEIPNLK